jgi:hypothetical protein
MFSTINDSWKVVENIVEKWGFSSSVKNETKHSLNDKKCMIMQESIHYKFGKVW